MGIMRLRGPRISVVSVAVTLAVAAAVLFSFPGCGGSTPRGAVLNLLSAWQALNWESYKKAVTPSQKLTKDQEELAKQKFMQIKVKFDDVKTETKYDPKDKNKATVTLTGGKATYTADILGKQRTETQDMARQDPKTRPVYDVVKINGVWYVDTTL